MKPDWKPIDSAPKDGIEFIAVWETHVGSYFIALTYHCRWTSSTGEVIDFFIGHTRVGREVSMDGFAKPIKWDHLPDMEV